MNLRSIVATALVTLAACTSPFSDVPAAGAWGEATVVEELSIGVEAGAITPLTKEDVLRSYGMTSTDRGESEEE